MIRVMTERPAVRDEQRSRTRQRIRWAVLELLDEGSVAEISVPAVAKQAGVSLRTVYRYFPTKAELIDSASHWYDDRAREFTQSEPTDQGKAGRFIEVLWDDFADNMAGIRAQHASPAGRELRRMRLADWRQRLGDSLAGRLAHLSPERRDEIVDLVIAMSSSSLFLELVDRMGYEPQRAAELATWSSAALLTAAAEEET